MNAATWAWIGLPVIIAAYVIGFDLAFPNSTMSAQFHIWMQSQLIGPIITGIWAGASVGLLYHFLING